MSDHSWSYGRSSGNWVSVSDAINSAILNEWIGDAVSEAVAVAMGERPTPFMLAAVKSEDTRAVVIEAWQRLPRDVRDALQRREGFHFTDDPSMAGPGRIASASPTDVWLDSARLPDYTHAYQVATVAHEVAHSLMNHRLPATYDAVKAQGLEDAAHFRTFTWGITDSDGNPL